MATGEVAEVAEVAASVVGENKEDTKLAATDYISSNDVIIE
jgi:hypothetical protein